MTADVSASLVTPPRGGMPGEGGGMDSPREGAEPSPRTSTEAGRLVLPSYERPAGVHPPLDFEGYRSTALRHPKQPLVLLPHRLTEVLSSSMSRVSSPPVTMKGRRHRAQRLS